VVGKVLYLRQTYHFRAKQDRDVPRCARGLGLWCDRPSSVAQVLYTADGLQ